jgi:hypothetical protein
VCRGDPAILKRAGASPDALIADRIVGEAGNIHYRMRATVELKCKPPFFLQDLPGVDGVTHLQMMYTSAHLQSLRT